MTTRITEYINDAAKGGPAAHRQLRQLLERYPYFQAARLLLLRLLFESHDPSFGQELRKASVYIPSRRVLYNLIEAERVKPVRESAEPKNSEKADDESNRTYMLIDNFLTATPETQPTTRYSHTRQWLLSEPRCQTYPYCI